MDGQQMMFLCFVIISVVGWGVTAYLLTVRIIEIRKKKHRLTALILNQEGSIREEFFLEGQKQVLIGKSTPSNLVNIDFSNSEYASTIEEQHAVLTYLGSSWYLESEAKNGKSGIRLNGDTIVYKLNKGVPYKISSGDTIYISYEKIIIR